MSDRLANVAWLGLAGSVVWLSVGSPLWLLLMPAVEWSAPRR